jgi:hypothetical protein
MTLHKLSISTLLLVVLGSAGLAQAADSTAAPLRTTVVAQKVEAVATTADDGLSLLLSTKNAKQARNVKLTGAVGPITEIRAAKWLGWGFVLAVETKDAKAGTQSYHWLTAWVGSEEVGQPAQARFLRTETDYDIAGVVNSQSDSINIVLTRHVREGERQTVDGYVFIHNCPVGQSEGELLPFSVGKPELK